MSPSSGSCIVAGHICLDIIPEIRDQRGFLAAIRPGHLLSVGAPTMAPGGSVSNTGLALHKLGIQTRMMGKIGDDTFGAELRACLNARSPDLVSGMRSAPNEHTSYTIILSPPDADRVFLHNSGPNDTFGPEDIDYPALHRADLFHFGYPTAMARMLAGDGEELAELLRRATETGITTSLDTSMFDRQGPAGRVDWEVLLARALPYVDIFLPSLDELLLMLEPELEAGSPDPALCRELAQKALDFGAGVVILKQGQNGLYLRTGEAGNDRDLGRAFRGAAAGWQNRELWAPAFKAQFVGATGAGDCAVAGFLAAVLRGLAPEDALIAAAAVGACNVEAADAASGVRAWTETLERINAGWDQHELMLPGWTRIETQDFASPRPHLWSGPGDSTSP